MAGATDFKHDRKLFTSSDGSSIIFFMRPCSERQEIRPVIEHGGGKVTSKVLPGSIKLAEKGSIVSNEGYISTKFIKDCVEQNKLLDTQAYRVAPGTRVRAESGDSNKSKNSFLSDDSMAPASYIAEQSARNIKGRSKYTTEEDVAIMTYLIEEKRYSEATGTRVWKDMEMLKITNHSAQSMSARFRKTILPNIEQYKNHIDRKWISRLTGYLVKEKEPEFSADALFATKKTRPQNTSKILEFGDQFDFSVPDKTEKEAKKKAETARYKPVIVLQDFSKSPAKKVEMWLDNEKSSKEDSDPTSSKNGDERSSKQNVKSSSVEKGGSSSKDISKDTVKSPKKTVLLNENSDHSNLKLGKESSSKQKVKNSSVEMGENSSNEIAKSSSKQKENKVHTEKGEINSKEIEKNSSKQLEANVNRSNDNENSSLVVESITAVMPENSPKRSLRLKRKARTRNNCEDDKHESTIDKTESKLQEKTKSDSDVLEKVSSVNESEEQKEHDSDSDIFKIREDSLDEKDITEERDIADERDISDKRDIADKRDITGEKDIITLTVIAHDDGRLTLTEDSQETSSSDHELELEGVSQSSKPPRRLKRRAEGVNDANLNTKKRLIAELENFTEKPSVQEAKTSKGSKTVESQNKQSSNSVETQAPESELISSNEVTSSNQTDENNSAEKDTLDNNDEDSFDEMLKSLATNKEKNVIEFDGDEDFLTVVDSNTKDDSNKRKDKELNSKPSQKNHKTGSTGSRPERRDDSLEKEILECSNTCKSISRKFGLSTEFVRQLLYQCSGDVNRTESYINYGCHSKELPPWTTAEDELLEKNPQSSRLMNKFGLEDIKDRINFLNYIS